MTASIERVATPLRARGVFPALDGLRIIAVTAVVMTHSAFSTGNYGPGRTGRAVLSHLDIGVAIFFVISGFLISREWLQPDRDTAGLPSLRAYARRRGWRILPMYWLTVVVAFLALPANHARSWADWVRHLLLVQIYGDHQTVFGLTQTWSLSTEVAFYALLPALAWVIVRFAADRSRVPAVTVLLAGALALASLVWVGWVHASQSPALISAGYWLPSTLSWFMAGTALAGVRLGADTLGGRWALLDRLGDSPGVCLLVALSAFAAAITPIGGDPQDPFPGAGVAITHTVLYLVAATALVVPGVLGSGQGGVDTVFGHPVMRWLGRVSYSVFLVHLLVLEAVRRLLGFVEFTGRFWPLFGWTWVLSVAIAGGAYRFVERPAIRRGHRR